MGRWDEHVRGTVSCMVLFTFSHLYLPFSFKCRAPLTRHLIHSSHLAHGELKIFLALAMSTYNFEIVPGSTMPGFEHEWVGLGVLHARGDLRVSVYRRS
jgi:hypothetical protein